MKRILLIATLLFTSILSAQDWAPFKASDTLVQFKDDSISVRSAGPLNAPLILSYAIQSVSVKSVTSQGNETVIIFEKGYPLIAAGPWWHWYYQNGLKIKGRILGDTAIISSDSSIFKTIDSNGYRLTFPHQYKRNQTWTLGKSISSIINATVDSIYFDSVGQFGMDSLAQIYLTVLNDSNIVLPNHKLQNFKLLISKNHGLVKTIDFSDLDRILNVSFKRYYLSNNAYTNNDYNVLTVGDEYHYNYDRDFWPRENTDHIAKIISDTTIGLIRTITIEDSWFNHYNNTRRKDTMFNVFDISEISHNKKSMIVNDSEINNLWGNASILFHTENFKFSSIIEYKTMFLIHPTQNQKDIARIYFTKYEHALETLRPIGFPFDKYKSDSWGGLPETEVTTHTYFKKGNQTWGTPFTFTVGLEEKSALENSIQLYPNPVKDIITIKSTEKIQLVRIYTIDGKMQLESQNSPNIEISNFQSGLYLIEITTNRGVVTKRLIKE
ncbi:T9SS type A sorting domain-containing protein [Acidiluteibacter ferrifornacis]|uniref:T9SS type A sorting domain-containing protein n=1 Tax=Acidiluteibacter ferrifornacis TaxID=2692424 RepID=A0A6N9NMG3_9FLAO|nr:T9SS type A sorting domain-containing protein [Acidiluteibacter ferrifornacis]NBG67049.1 T9SS type A sorting domain-containing protein [Acidiluteibacter ferrifornacis]